jgi:hypothetical protein
VVQIKGRNYAVRSRKNVRFPDEIDGQATGLHDVVQVGLAALADGFAKRWSLPWKFVVGVENASWG